MQCHLIPLYLIPLAIMLGIWGAVAASNPSHESDIAACKRYILVNGDFPGSDPSKSRPCKGIYEDDRRLDSTFQRVKLIAIDCIDREIMTGRICTYGTKRLRDWAYVQSDLKP